MNAILPQRPMKKKMTLKRQLRRIFVMVIASFLGVCVMLAFLQRQLIYIPRKGPVSIEDSGFSGGQIREVFLPVAKGIELHGWYCQPVVGSERISPRLAIIFPGNGGNRLNRVRILNQLSELGCDALIFDYRGYGGSGGKPSETAITADSLKVWDFAKSELGFTSDQIVICGQSLGGGVATCLAWELCEQGEPPAGLLLRATFTSLVDAAQVHYPWLPVNALMYERYPSEERIPEIVCPLLVIHGKQDTIVPFELGERLFEAAPQQSYSGLKKRFIELPQAGHNDIMYVAADDVHQATDEFLIAIERAAKKEQ